LIRIITGSREIPVKSLGKIAFPPPQGLACLLRQSDNRQGFLCRLRSGSIGLTRQSDPEAGKITAGSGFVGMIGNFFRLFNVSLVTNRETYNGPIAD
jgi:hypothetical protein